MSVANIQSVVISGYGACTGLGGSVTAAAAFRTGIKRPNRLADVSVNDDEIESPPEFFGYPAGSLTESFEGVGRWAHLGAAAYLDLLHSYPLHSNALSDTCMLLVLPSVDFGPIDDPEELDAIAELEAEHRSTIVQRIDALAGVAIAQMAHKCFFGGCVEFVLALSQAVDLLRSGRHKRCIVGVIDSLLDPPLLANLMEVGRLKGVDSPSGLMPGEAAVFISLELDVDAPAGASRVLLGGPIITQEPGRKQNSSVTGRYLAEAVRRAMGEVTVTNDGEIYANLNGETRPAQEWGLAVSCFGSDYSVRDWPLHVPQQVFGDIGATAGALSIVLACRAYARGYSRGHQSLVLCSDEQGQHAAVLVVNDPK